MSSPSSESLSGDDARRSELSLLRFIKLLESLEEKGISQKAAALRVKVPPQYVSDVKAGRRAMTELFARRLENEFRVDRNWLLGSSGSQEMPAVASGSESGRIWLPAFPHPISGEPQLVAGWDGACVEVTGAAAALVAVADRPYALRFGEDDRYDALIKNVLEQYAAIEDVVEKYSSIKNALEQYAAIEDVLEKYSSIKNALEKYASIKNVLKKNDLLLVSQASNPAAEFQVVKSGSTMFLARASGSTGSR